MLPGLALEGSEGAIRVGNGGLAICPWKPLDAAAGARDEVTLQVTAGLGHEMDVELLKDFLSC
ncbi:hypothetical protein OG474_17790 [Kribbella sp. NBC_01505]|uniref:hypothetical protein n=1 Tax=Kribbella sp. NBC_01505 TaxID=2903580 RepID=UPI00386B4D4B